jgi:hypothetical protein
LNIDYRGVLDFDLKNYIPANARVEAMYQDYLLSMGGLANWVKF